MYTKERNLRVVFFNVSVGFWCGILWYFVSQIYIIFNRKTVVYKKLLYYFL